MLGNQNNWLPLGTLSALLAVNGAQARSDNSLSNLLGLANVDMFLNLEQAPPSMNSGDEDE